LRGSSLGDTAVPGALPQQEVMHMHRRTNHRLLEDVEWFRRGTDTMERVDSAKSAMNVAGLRLSSCGWAMICSSAKSFNRVSTSR